MTDDAPNAGMQKTLPLIPLLVRLGRAKRTADVPDDDLSDLASHCEVWSQRWGYLVVVGVIINVWIALKNPWHRAITEEYGPVAASGCVAIGVWLEILFSKFGSKFQREAVRRSNNKLRDVTIVPTESAEARSETAKLRERAAKAELEAAKLRRDFGWRALTVETAETLVSKFSTMPGTRLRISFPDQDVESRNFATQLAGQFIRSGWFVTSEAAPPDSTYDMGITVRQGASMPGRLILGALQELGFQASSGWALDIPEDECDSRCELLIGPKRMPSANSDEEASADQP